MLCFMNSSVSQAVMWIVHCFRERFMVSLALVVGVVVKASMIPVPRPRVSA